MTPKTYRAPSMTEALTDVRRDFGSDAVILRTRSYRRGGFLGLWGGKPMCEVTASPHVHVAPGAVQRDRPVSGAEPDDKAEENSRQNHRRRRENIANGSTSVAVEPAEPQMGQMSEIYRMLKTLLHDRPAQPKDALSDILIQWRDHLLSQEVSRRIAADLVNQLQLELTGQDLAQPQIVRNRLGELIAARIPCVQSAGGAEEISSGRVIALIGPTGVGKTTTIAKLAANMKLKERKRVGLITIDTYRIAAVDQLQTYAEIIEVPLRTVLTPREMQQAIYAMRGMDAILIDTAGRSQNDSLRLNQLRSFLEAAGAHEVHLVIAGTSGQRCAVDVLSRFRVLGANRLIITKLDEADANGMILNVTQDGKLPVSFISMGQEVPDDIAVADGRELARRIMEGGENETG